MFAHMLKSKLHRATVTGADLEYEGSISICPQLIDKAKFFLNEKVDIYNCTNGERFSTYVIPGNEGEICLNGAAARKAHRGDVVIIAAYLWMSTEEAAQHKPELVFIGDNNQPK